MEKIKVELQNEIEEIITLKIRKIHSKINTNVVDWHKNRD